MLPINFDTCTARDVILRSLVCHPSLFADCLASAAAEHRHYAARNPASFGASGARAAHRHTMDAINHLHREYSEGATADRLMGDQPAAVQAFTVAARLNLVPAHCVAAISARTWPEAAAA